MRFVSALVLTIVLAGCSYVDQQTAKTVDPANLPPLSSREQALIFGADGAAQQKNYEAAERDYLAAIAASTGRVEAHLALANLYEKQHQPEKKHTILKSALELQPNHPLANYLVGKLYLDRGHYTEALSAFKRGRVTASDDMDLAMGEAVTLDMLGRHEDAQALYTQLIRNHPGAALAIVRTNLAMSYLLSNRPQQAVDILKNEATRPGASPVSRHNLALAYGLLGRNADAKALLNGEIDEETRLLTVARMRSYHQERMADRQAVPPEAMVMEVQAPEEAPIKHPAPVVQRSSVKPKPAASVVAKPSAVKKADAAPAVEVKPVVKQPAAAAKPAPSKPEAKVSGQSSDSLDFDPNYVPGLTDEEGDL